MKGKGLFIVLDGPEGGGKSTQSGYLAESFRQAGCEVLQTFEPGGTKTGAGIRGLLSGPESEDLDPMTEALLFSADRSWHIKSVVKPALVSGKIIICDRYASSTWAYQGWAGGLGTSIVRQLTELAADDIEPDLLLTLDLDPAVGFRRKQGDELDRIEQKSPRFHRQVREGFLDYAFHHQSFCDVVEADQDRLVVHAEIIRAVNERFGLELSPVLDV